jgi:hypothetical protein
MTKNQKIMIGVGAAVLFCLCAIGVSIFAFRTVVDKAKGLVSTDPNKIATVAEGIAQFDIPAGYAEQMSMDFGIYQIVIISDSNDSSKPMIMLMSYKSSGVDAQQMQEQMQRSLEQQTGQPGVTWTTVDQHKITIRGQEVNVIVREGRGSNVVMRQLVTAFEGKNGTVIVMIQGDAASWDQKLIDNFLASIQ